MATSSSIWSRVKTRWMSWNHTVQPQTQHPAQPPRYEYPEAHRHSNNSNQRIPNSTSTSTTTSALKDPNELLQQQLVDHPLHQTYYQRWLHNSLRGVAKFVFWTTAHATAMYLFYFYIKPRLHKYFQHVQLLQGGDDDDDDYCDDDDDDNYNNNNDEDDNNNNSDDSSFTRWKRRLWNKWNGICTTSKNPKTKTSTPTTNKSKLKKRLCCCCDAKVSARDNYCPSCGSPTFPLCIYCGEGLPTNVNFCPSCGRPVPHQVIVDGGEGDGDGRTSPNTSLLSLPQRHALSSQRRSSTGSTLSSHNNISTSPGNTNSPTQSHLPVTQFPHHAVLRPPYLTHTTSSQCQEKEDATTSSSFAEAESVPFVQADDYLPLVPAMYVEEVTAIPAPITFVEPANTVASNATTVATSGNTDATSNSAQQQGVGQDQQQQISSSSSSSQQYDSVNDDSNTKESNNKQQ